MKKKRLHIVAACIAMVMFILATASGCKAAGTSNTKNTKAEDTVSVTVNGKAVKGDVDPVIKDGRTLVPVRAVFEAMGADVDWDGDTSTATCRLNGLEVKITIGEAKFTVNGESRELEVPAEIIDGRTMIPVRAVSEALNCKVDWDGNTRTVIINTNGSGIEPNSASTANTASIAKGYYDVLSGMIKDYGLADWDEGWNGGPLEDTGVAYAQLIDFDNNSVPELFVVVYDDWTGYGYQSDWKPFIYTYANNRVKLVDDIGYEGGVPFPYIALKEHDNKTYVFTSDTNGGYDAPGPDDPYYENFMVKEFDGEKFVDILVKEYTGVWSFSKSNLINAGYTPEAGYEITTQGSEYSTYKHTVKYKGQVYNIKDDDEGYDYSSIPQDWLVDFALVADRWSNPYDVVFGGYDLPSDLPPYADTKMTVQEVLENLAIIRDSSSLDYAAAYKAELEKLVETYGIDRYEDYGKGDMLSWDIGGLVNIKLVDFNADGTPEMFVYYSDDGNCVRVYAYKNGRAEVVYELDDRDLETTLRINIHDYGNEKLLCYEYSDRRFISQSYEHETHSTSRAMRFNGNDFEELGSIKEVYGMSETEDYIADLDGVTNEDLRHTFDVDGEYIGLGKVAITENGTTKVYYLEYTDRLIGGTLSEDFPNNELVNMFESIDETSFTSGRWGEHNKEDYPINEDIILEQLNTLSNAK